MFKPRFSPISSLVLDIAAAISFMSLRGRIDHVASVRETGHYVPSPHSLPGRGRATKNADEMNSLRALMRGRVIPRVGRALRWNQRAAIASMTNYQRNQWQRGGCKITDAVLDKFCSLPTRKVQGRHGHPHVVASRGEAGRVSFSPVL